MDKVKFPKNYLIYLPLLVLFVALVLLLPRSGKFGYDYKKGSAWTYENLVAQFDFPVLKTEEQILAEKDKLGSESIPYFRYSQEAHKAVTGDFDKINLGAKENLRPLILSTLDELYESGVVSDYSGNQHVSEDRVIFVQRDKRAQKLVSADVFTQNEACEWFSAKLQSECPTVDVDSFLEATKLLSVIRPDLVYDAQATSLVHQKSIDYISTTSGVVEAGTLIVKNGEIITEEVKQILDSYKAEYNNSVGYNGPVILLWIGNAMLALIIVILLFLSICFGNAQVFESLNRYLYLLTVFLMSAVTTMLVDKYAPDYIYLVPYSVIALYLLAFFKKRVVMPAYIMSLVPLLIISNNGVELFMMQFFAGMVCIVTFSHFSRNWLQFVNIIFIFLSCLTVWFTFKLINGTEALIEYKDILFMFLGAFLCILAYPLIYLFEKMFNLVSSARLRELCESSNKLQRELAQKAPGTFQHSLQVANLAEAAAHAIDANVLLTRAGALYHDIGKINNPLCFVENQTPGVDYHKDLTPAESARDIIRHVSDGMEIADKYSLPGIVKAFIETHHGTTSASYFLTKYLNDGGDPDSTDVFYYKGVIPKTKEQSIVMVCDTLEAASRTLQDYSPGSVSNFVEGIFQSKSKAGQFEDSELTQHEIGVIKETLKEYICRIHHARIVYPKRKERRKS